VTITLYLQCTVKANKSIRFLDAADAGKLKAFFASPVGVYGKSKSDLSVDSQGVWVKWMIGNSSQLGYSPYIGDGTAVFQTVSSETVML
jgi:hypothetical protein